ncbi:MAG: N-6 DNA methylase [Clostridiales bacterium]|nr:N-6 DNA methylase [Clostridiales bacterium]
MEDHREQLSVLKEKIREILEKLQLEQERKPLRLALQLGYLSYVRLFVESQKRESLQRWFPYAGFPMEWTRGEEEMESRQRVWQLQYQVQYCSSIVEEGHFMEQSRMEEKEHWAVELCKLIDWISDHADWTQGMPGLFGMALEEMVRQIYSLGNSGLFLMPDAITDLLIQLVGKENPRTVWNPSCRTGEFSAAVCRTHSRWELRGSEREKEPCLLAQMILFYYGGEYGEIVREDPLEQITGDLYDLIVSNPPVGELDGKDQERYSVATRKTQLQYLQMVMNHLQKHGLAVVVVNEGTLFKFDAEMKVRERLLEDFELQGVISLPSGAFLPYTGGKASILIFSNSPEKVGENSAVWFYELHEPGYTLDKKQEITAENEIPQLLQAWADRKEMEVEWRRQLAGEEKKNQWENPVPAGWPEVHYWFADRKTIRQNDYNLTAGRYKPWKESREEMTESPLELLEQLAGMEKETMEEIKELIEMTKNYG